MVLWYQLDQTFCMKFSQGLLSQGTSDFQSFWHDWWRDQLIAGNFFVQLVICSFVKKHQVVKLVTDFSLGPLLFLGLSTTTTFFFLCWLCLLGVLGILLLSFFLQFILLLMSALFWFHIYRKVHERVVTWQIRIIVQRMTYQLEVQGKQIQN